MSADQPCSHRVAVLVQFGATYPMPTGRYCLGCGASIEHLNFNLGPGLLGALTQLATKYKYGENADCQLPEMTQDHDTSNTTSGGSR